MTHPSNILVVEDRADWQDILGTTLRQYGYVPTSAFTYQEAVTALEQVQFSLAVIDPVLDMANRFNRDGLSIVQKLHDTQPDIPIIILTGSLTHDMEVSLKHLYPGAPILFKESWEPAEFGALVDRLIGQHFTTLTTSPLSAANSINFFGAPLAPPSPVRAIGRPRVLLVENRQDWQEIVATVLEEQHYFWRVAQTAPEAVHQLESQSFHLVILDLKLQPTDLPLRSNEGWLLLDYLIDKHPKTKVVILSGKAGPSDVADLLTQYPIIGYIEKQTFNPQAIIEAVTRAARSPQLRLQTFGQFQIWRDGQAIGIWDNLRAETLVKLLLVRRAHGGQAVAADELMDRLWAQGEQKELLSLVSSARLTLEPDIDPRDSNFILREANGYTFDLGETVSWDLLDFRQAMVRGQWHIEQGAWGDAIDLLEQGRALYKSDFLADEQQLDWIVETRRQIVTEYCQLLAQLADAYAVRQNYPHAIKTCEEILEKDPLLEEVYRRLMHFHYCNGSKELALKAYRNCLKVFEELFGESPTLATRQLYEAIANSQPLDCPPHK
jgi:DNA-binding SARP family transcriptional activator/ActR/RegA family two-component response regulator